MCFRNCVKYLAFLFSQASFDLNEICVDEEGAEAQLNILTFRAKCKMCTATEKLHVLRQITDESYQNRAYFRKLLHIRHKCD